MKKLGIVFVSMLISAVAFGATFNFFAPATGVLKGSSSTYVTTPAVSSDIAGLWSGTCNSSTYLRGDGTCATPPGTGGGTVNSVALTAPSVFSVSGSPVTNTGTLALTFATGQTANQFLATPNGTTGAVGLRSIVAADLPSISLTSGVTGTLPFGNGGTNATSFTNHGLIVAGASSLSSLAVLGTDTLLQGTTGADPGPVSVPNCGSSTQALAYSTSTHTFSCQTISAGTGTVTSVGLTAPSVFSVSGSPITGSGTLGVTFATGQTANQVLATPNGTTGAVGLRALVGADIPATNLASNTNGGVTGILSSANGGTSNGFFTVSGPATSTKTFTFPNASATVLTTNATVTVAQGGTGATTLTGLVLGNGTSAMTPYAGTSCTNQFPRSLNASGAATCASVANTDLINSNITLNGSSISLGGSKTLTLASSDFVNQGTTTTVLHGNAAGNPSFAAVSLTTDVSGILPSANGGTSNGFFTVSGPATSTKTFTFPNANANVLTDNATVTVAQGGTGAATLTGYVKGNGTSAFTASSTIPYSDLTGTPSIPTGANPSVSAGLTAVNGSAMTYMRSDAAPAISQSISPTWTGTHLFTGALQSNVTTAAINPAVNGTRPSLRFTDTAGGANGKAWQFDTDSTHNIFQLRTFDDTLTTTSTVFAATRSGQTITNLSFGNSTDNPSYTFSGTGTASFGGAVTATGAISGSNLSSAGGANPSASVGLSAVNGSATTYMRSDAAPAISQSIAPTWTGNHSWVQSSNSTIIPVTIQNTSTGTAARTDLRLINSAHIAVMGITSGPFTGSVWTGGTTGEQQFLGTFASIPLTIGTNTTERITIASTGAVTVQAPTSGTGLTVNGSSSSTPALNIASGTLQVGGSTGTPGQVLTSQGSGAAPIWASGTVSTSGTFTATLSGMTASCTATLSYKVIGGIAFLYNDTGADVTCTSNTSSMSMTGIPSAIQPATSRTQSTFAIDNGVFKTGVFAISGSSAQFDLCNTISCNASNFTSTGTKGVPIGWMVSYPL